MNREPKDKITDDDLECVDGIVTHVAPEAAEGRPRRRGMLVRNEVPLDDSPRRVRKD